MGDYLDRLDQWVEHHRGQLQALGRVHYSKPPGDGRINPSAHFAVLRELEEVELLLWELGDAEFNYGPSAAATMEHHDLDSLVDLDQLLARLSDHLQMLGASTDSSPA